MSETESIAAPTSCEGCGLTVKSEALFCTGCGTRTPKAASSAAVLTCTKCATSLRAGAEFCTECGTASALGGAIDLSVDESNAPGTKSASTGTVPPSQVTAADRVSPAASRAILGSVSGGMGSYVGSPRTAGGAGSPPPTTAVRSADAAAHRKKNLAIVAVVGALLLITAVVGILVATQKDHGSELRAGQPTGRTSDDEVLTTNAKGETVSTTGAPKSDKPKSKAKSDTKKDSKDSKVTPKSGGKSDSKKPPKKSQATTPGTTGTPGTSGTTQPPGKGPVYWGTAPPTGGNPPQTQPPAVVKPPPGPARLAMSGAEVALSGNAPSRTVYVSNSGGSAMSWDATLTGIPGATLSPNSGSVPAGKWVAIKVTWSPWAPGGSVRPSSDEGAWTGTLSVNARGAGAQNVTVRASNTSGDVITAAYIDHCESPSGGLCRAGTVLRVNVARSAQGGFTGSFPAMIRFAVNNFELTGWQTISPYRENTYPTAQIKITIANSVRPGSSTLRMIVSDETGTEGPESSVVIFSR